jgi:hypothetical protein
MSIPRARFLSLLLSVVFAVTLHAAAPPPAVVILPTPPQDLPTRNASLDAVARFAWQEFLALNWKASVDPQHPATPANPRGKPDPAWNYSRPLPQTTSAQRQYPLVWQTYAQTTELRPNARLTTRWENLGVPNYSYSRPPANLNAFRLWNNLDEDSEIGSCNIYSRYAQQGANKALVLFQVKVNRDEYEYLRLNFPDQNNPQGSLATVAGRVSNNIRTTTTHDYYPGQVSTCGPCTVRGVPAAICLPCGSPAGQGRPAVEGAIEVKTGWRLLLPGENPSRFFTTVAQYYDFRNGTLTTNSGVFALVAMHIIHKTANFPDFVYATFEQVDVENSGSVYWLLDNNGNQTGGPVPIRRQPPGSNNSYQLHPVPPTLDNVTRAVWQQLRALNANTPWQYYRLTGVLSQSVDCPVSFAPGQVPNEASCVANQFRQRNCTALNPNYYMANFMVESDPFLNSFSGPGFGENGAVIFKGGCQNTVYNRQLFNNGGCKGCHGVAQTALGADFSFLLDFGNNKPAVVPAVLHPAGTNAAAVELRPLKQYMKMLSPTAGHETQK